ncbi:MAG: ATP-binding protein [Phycisphaerales bacterium]|nr:FHA domain-containing protein [Planctomycetota bacterium]
MLILTVIQGPDKGRTFQLPDHEPQLIGRSGEALPLTDTTVSRRHAEMTPDNGTWFIRDLQSQNGTYVNADRIRERVRLRPGDQIRVGATLIVFGFTETSDPDIVRLARPGQVEASIEQTLAGDVLSPKPAVNANEESLVMAEPEPRAAAATHLRVIYQLTSLTSQLTERPELLKSVMEMVFREFKPERGFIVLTKPGDIEKTRPAVVKYRTPPANEEEARIHVPRTILQHVLKKGEGVLSSNAMNDPRFAAGDSVQRMHVRSAICSPISFRGGTFGAIYIDSTLANYTYTSEQLALMNAVGQHTGLALANAEGYARRLQTERLAAVGETVASLSHSIKNILQGIRGGADVVELGLKKDDLKIAKGGWDIFKRNLDRISSLTSNMLAYSRHRKPEVELTKFQQIVDDCIELLRPGATSKNVAIIVDIDSELPPIAIDPGLMHQALLNLLTNAVEAVEPVKGVITVRAYYMMSPPGSPPTPAAISQRTAQPHHSPGSQPTGALWAIIDVIDNGPGIAKGKQQWIFLPFNTTKGLRGTGLGLAVAKRVSEDHGGLLTVESDEGKGSIFRMIVPADPVALIDPSATTGEKDQPGKGRSL